MAEPLAWYETVAYTYWAIVFVALTLLDIIEITTRKTVEYSYFGVFCMFVLGFPGFVAALGFCCLLRVSLWFILQLGTAFTDPDKFWGRLKLFTFKEKKR